MLAVRIGLLANLLWYLEIESVSYCFPRRRRQGAEEQDKELTSATWRLTVSREEEEEEGYGRTEKRVDSVEQGKRRQRVRGQVNLVGGGTISIFKMRRQVFGRGSLGLEIHPPGAATPK